MFIDLIIPVVLDLILALFWSFLMEVLFSPPPNLIEGRILEFKCYIKRTLILLLELACTQPMSS